MSIPRVIVSMLLRGNGFVKTRRFDEPVYLGDCFNTLRLFNEKEADELMVLDIAATREGRPPRVEFLRELASECFMPLGYGGGIQRLEEMRRLYNAGFEKLSINTLAFRNPGVVREATREFGSQSVVVWIDYRRKLFGKNEVYVSGGKDATGVDAVTFAQRAEEMGAGELVLNSIDRDGMMQGYDLEIIRKVADAVSVPVIACGGAGSLADFRGAIDEGHASGVAAGSFFVFTGRHRAVLITYPSHDSILREIGK
jgi:cyclase